MFAAAGRVGAAEGDRSAASERSGDSVRFERGSRTDCDGIKRFYAWLFAKLLIRSCIAVEKLLNRKGRQTKARWAVISLAFYLVCARKNWIVRCSSVGRLQNPSAMRLGLTPSPSYCASTNFLSVDSCR